MCSTLDGWNTSSHRRRGRAGRQAILNSTGARMPEHTFKTPVPVVVRIVWEHDGEEHIETIALG